MWATSKNNVVIIEYIFPSPYLTFIFLISLKKTTLGRHNKSALYWRNIIVQQTEKKTMRLTSLYEHLFIFIFFRKTLPRLGLKLILTKVNNTNSMYSAMLSSSKPTSPTVYEQCLSWSYNKYSWVFFFSFKGQSFKWVPGTFFDTREQVKFSPNSQKKPVCHSVPCRVSHHSRPEGWFSVWRQGGLQQGGGGGSPPPNEAKSEWYVEITEYVWFSIWYNISSLILQIYYVFCFKIYLDIFIYKCIHLWIQHIAWAVILTVHLHVCVCVCVCVFPLGGELLCVPSTTLTGLNKVAFSLKTDQFVICRSRSDFLLLSLQIMLKLKKQ